eukprot:TRINITY_DN433_c0_g1_i1.p1 TRINITY_DN433_c0_g1~~TRINITY_DN433_c0_g1_i1.p1  ORF type:complete len:444 (+),score=147.63 TRINITY_DN433_c0_g1_i1:292-1623(+)
MKKKSTFTKGNRRKKRSVKFSDAEEDNEKKKVVIIDDNNNNNNNNSNGVSKERKKTIDSQSVGTKISVIGKREVVSSGHAMIDEILGGGIGIGHLNMIQEDINSRHYLSLLKLFISQGLCLPEPHQSVLILSGNPKELFPLPKPLRHSLKSRNNNNNSNEVDEEENEEDEPKKKLKIAWRYDVSDNKSSSSSLKNANFRNVFDFHKHFELTENQSNSLNIIDISEISIKHSSSLNFYKELLTIINQHIQKNQEENKVLRIILHSIGSPLWKSNQTIISQQQEEKIILRFLYSIKGLIRNRKASCLFSISGHLHSIAFITKIKHLGDFVSAFESFKGAKNTVVGAAFKDYTGLYKVYKLPRINTLTSNDPDTLEFVFSRKRHKFVIEVFSLPPETTRTTESKGGGIKNLDNNNNNNDMNIKKKNKNITSVLCNTNPLKENVLDF